MQNIAQFNVDSSESGYSSWKLDINELHCFHVASRFLFHARWISSVCNWRANCLALSRIRWRFSTLSFIRSWYGAVLGFFRASSSVTCPPPRQSYTIPPLTKPESTPLPLSTQMTKPPNQLTCSFSQSDMCDLRTAVGPAVQRPCRGPALYLFPQGVTATWRCFFFFCTHLSSN